MVVVESLKTAPGKLDRTSVKAYAFLLGLLVLSTAITVFLPMGDFATLPENLPAPKGVLALANAAVVLIVYGVLGYLGLRLAKRLSFPDLWNKSLSSFQRWSLPALLGVGIGVFFIVADLVFQRFHTFGALPHPPFPTSLVASLTAGIGEEIIFRLFFIPFWIWFIARVLLKGQSELKVFWGVAVVSALVFAVAHVPSAMVILGFSGVEQIPVALWVEIIVLNGLLSMAAAYFFKEHGFMSAVGIHFWTDVVWHVLWGALN